MPERGPDAAPAERAAVIGATLRVAELDDLTKEAMWQLFARYYDDVDRRRFLSDLAEKSHVILVRDARDLSVQGFGTLLVREVVFDGRAVNILYTGDTVVERRYWGQTAVQRQFLLFCLRTWLRAPLTPLYWFLISKGFRTYLLLSRNLPNHWPNARAPTPAREARLLDQVSRLFFRDAYRPDRGVIVFPEPRGRLKGGVAPIDARALSHDDVRFFAERNPGHVHGEELCCLGRVDLAMIQFNVRKYLFGAKVVRPG